MKCPAFREGGPGSSGNVCGETGISGPVAMRRACTIAAHTDSNCNITTPPPIGFLTKWKGILTRRVRRDENLLG